MSQRNAEIVRTVLEKASGPDRISGMVRHFSEDVEWETDPTAPEPGTYRGRDAVKTYLEGLSQGFGELRFDVRQLLDLDDDQVFAETTAHGSGGVSGAEVELPWCFIVSLRDGNLARIRSFLDKGRALQAAGLSE